MTNLNTRPVTPICSAQDCDWNFDWILPARDGSQFLAHSDDLMERMTARKPGRTGFDPGAVELVLNLLTQDCATEAPEVVKLLIQLCHPRSRSLSSIMQVSPVTMKLLTRFGIRFKMVNVLDICRYYFKKRFSEEPLFTFGLAAKTEDIELSNQVIPLSLGFKKSEIQDSLGGPGLYHDYFTSWIQYRKSLIRLIQKDNPPSVDHKECKSKRKKFHSNLSKSLKVSPQHLFDDEWRLEQMDILRSKLNRCRECLQAYEVWLIELMRKATQLPSFESILREAFAAQARLESERYCIEEAEEYVQFQQYLDIYPAPGLWRP
ncbi:hypothetical protein BDN72DRAFT_845805 [Pluteus cervinus]|uniref:Uncharacterized protein n=1 Tax=Pluteus cervinus TaxID=181527 RepID=A0ACD3AHQ6_9AGAR|nr:hypothetical protein BDN72DRAFT_845805 [Pluteus cervinus]